MKKIFLSVIGLYLVVLSSFSQQKTPADTVFKKRKLKFEEANIVSSYYTQDGNNAAVTGGIGSQALTDFSNSIDLKLSKYDRRNRKHNFSFETGIDHYTSASSDKIDPSTISSASYSDTRFYPSLGWRMENEKKGSSVGAGIYFSTEFDYQSFGGNINYTRKSADRSGEFSAKLQAFIDQLRLIYPIELRKQGDEGSAGRNTFSGTVSWSQIINRNFQVLAEGEFVYQSGYLGLPFNRVYFDDNSVHVENLPDSRWKIPVGLRANYFLGDRLILRAWYRFYKDSWNISSNTFQIETSVKITPFLSITPFYRFYQQTAADAFAPYKAHTSADKFYTSNYDLSAFNSQFFGAGLRVAPPGGIINYHLSAIEIRYGHYAKNIDMNADILTLNLKFR
ncbi:DUF3570 domain-containing protein [Pollutibacter soli]|uniref:DUF3570 domain-containing protein n=1 Tax=Pollutibacter soli TaxID=3034157 RepID=UPI003013B03B